MLLGLVALAAGELQVAGALAGQTALQAGAGGAGAAAAVLVLEGARGSRVWVWRPLLLLVVQQAGDGLVVVAGEEVAGLQEATGACSSSFRTVGLAGISRMWMDGQQLRVDREKEAF